MTADYYGSTLPVEPMVDLLDADLEAAAPSLGGVRELETAFMNGIQYYLTEDIPMIEGRGIYSDSP